MFEDDTRNPFMPGDDLPKPSEGDVLILRETETMQDIPKRLTVTRTHDNLAESWDPLGEDAWAMRDANDAAGFKGHWYAYGTGDDSTDPDEYLVASYEVAVVEKS